MYRFTSTAFVPAARAAVWAVWTDLAAYPQWDPREQVLRLDGPFAAGTEGYSKQQGNPGGPFRIESVQPEEGFVNVSALPGGALRIEHRIDPEGAGARVTKTYVVTGPMEVAFRVWWGPATLRAMPATWAALASRVTATA